MGGVQRTFAVDAAGVGVGIHLREVSIQDTVDGQVIEVHGIVLEGDFLAAGNHDLVGTHVTGEGLLAVQGQGAGVVITSDESIGGRVTINAHIGRAGQEDAAIGKHAAVDIQAEAVGVDHFEHAGIDRHVRSIAAAHSHIVCRQHSVNSICGITDHTAVVIDHDFGTVCGSVAAQQSVDRAVGDGHAAGGGDVGIQVTVIGDDQIIIHRDSGVINDRAILTDDKHVDVRESGLQLSQLVFARIVIVDHDGGNQLLGIAVQVGGNLIRITEGRFQILVGLFHAVDDNRDLIALIEAGGVAQFADVDTGVGGAEVLDIELVTNADELQTGVAAGVDSVFHVIVLDGGFAQSAPAGGNQRIFRVGRNQFADDGDGADIGTRTGDRQAAADGEGEVGHLQGADRQDIAGIEGQVGGRDGTSDHTALIGQVQFAGLANANITIDSTTGKIQNALFTLVFGNAVLLNNNIGIDHTGFVEVNITALNSDLIIWMSFTFAGDGNGGVDISIRTLNLHRGSVGVIGPVDYNITIQGNSSISTNGKRVNAVPFSIAQHDLAAVDDIFIHLEIHGAGGIDSAVNGDIAALTAVFARDTIEISGAEAALQGDITEEPGGAFVAVMALDIGIGQNRLIRNHDMRSFQIFNLNGAVAGNPDILIIAVADLVFHRVGFQSPVCNSDIAIGGDALGLEGGAVNIDLASSCKVDTRADRQSRTAGNRDFASTQSIVALADSQTISDLECCFVGNFEFRQAEDLIAGVGIIAVGIIFLAIDIHLGAYIHRGIIDTQTAADLGEVQFHIRTIGDVELTGIGNMHAITVPHCVLAGNVQNVFTFVFGAPVSFMSQPDPGGVFVFCGDVVIAGDRNLGSTIADFFLGACRIAGITNQEGAGGHALSKGDIAARDLHQTGAGNLGIDHAAIVDEKFAGIINFFCCDGTAIDTQLGTFLNLDTGVQRAIDRDTAVISDIERFSIGIFEADS